MDFDPTPFTWFTGIGENPQGLTYWFLVILAVSVIALFVGLVVSVLTMGARGPGFTFSQIKRAAGEAIGISGRRLAAIVGLTVRESLRRKALWIFAIFALLFMFAGWFLGGSSVDAAKPYIVFVLKAITWLSLPLAILLACWGLPQDIKDRSLHTVVTKPVRRMEIVLGRMIGYSIVTGTVVIVMSAVGYVWLLRTVPADVRDRQLVGRVPLYGTMAFISRDGQDARGGISVGDLWEYRSYIDGNTLARAVYTFRNLPVDDLRVRGIDDGEEGKPGIKFDYNFEIFRSFKGDLERGVQGQFEFVNDQGTEDTADDVLVRYPVLPFELKEFSTDTDSATLNIPEKLLDAEGNEYDLFDDLMTEDGTLKVRVRCVDSQQYLGAAQSDLFVRLPDRPFWVGYLKASFGILLQTVLLVVVGTSISCIVKGPVSTLFTFGVFLLGQQMRKFADEFVIQQFLEKGEIIGGGPLESVYRLVTKAPQTLPLQQEGFIPLMQDVDKVLLQGVVLILGVVPNMRPYDMAPFLANSFDVPWESSMLPALMTTLAFLPPCVLLGYFGLQLRELEAK